MTCIKYFSLIILLIFSSCAQRPLTITQQKIKKKQIPVFIQMPSNHCVFASLAPLLYQAMHQQFLRMGYTVLNTSDNAYTIAIHAKSLDPFNKMISSQLTLLHYNLKLDIASELFDMRQQSLMKKSFTLSALLSKPHNPILTSDFTQYAYKNISERAARMVEEAVRPHLLEML